MIQVTLYIVNLTVPKFEFSEVKRLCCTPLRRVWERKKITAIAVVAVFINYGQVRIKMGHGRELVFKCPRPTRYAVLSYKNGLEKEIVFRLVAKNVFS